MLYLFWHKGLKWVMIHQCAYLGISKLTTVKTQSFIFHLSVFNNCILLSHHLTCVGTGFRAGRKGVQCGLPEQNIFLPSWPACREGVNFSFSRGFYLVDRGVILLKYWPTQGDLKILPLGPWPWVAHPGEFVGWF